MTLALRCATPPDAVPTAPPTRRIAQEFWSAAFAASPRLERPVLWNARAATEVFPLDWIAPALAHILSSAAPAEAPIRPYVDDKFAPWLLDAMIAQPPRPEDDLYEWLRRCARSDHAAIIVNSAAHTSAEIARRASTFGRARAPFKPMHNTDLEVVVFVGRYHFTPFGAHFDLPEESTVQFNIGSATKSYVLWDVAEFERLTNHAQNFQEVETILDRGTRFDVEPGGMMYLPPGLPHVALSEDFTVTVTLRIRDRPRQRTLRDAIGTATRQLAENDSLTRSSGAQFAAAVARAVESEPHRLASAGHLVDSFFEPPGARVSASEPVCIDPTFPIIMSEVDHLSCFVRGDTVRLTFPEDARAIVAILSNGAQSAHDLAGALGVPVDRVVATLRQLAEHRGLLRGTDVVSIGGERP